MIVKKNTKKILDLAVMAVKRDKFYMYLFWTLFKTKLFEIRFYLK